MRPSTELTSRYRLESLIAAGGMGEVWRAVDQALDRPVAVKLLRPEYVHDPVILARFHAEAHYVGQLADPGIAQVYDYADVGPASPAYLVMELVDGPSLAALLATGPLPPRRTADVLAQAAQALPGDPLPDRAPCRRGLLAAIFGLAVLVAGVVAWQLTGLSRPQRVAAPAASSPAMRPDVARTVRVTDALVGQPVSAVQRALRAHGLRVQVQPQPDRLAAPGTVLRVSPTGRLATGHLVLLTVAVRPPAAASSATSSQAGPTPPTAAPGNVPPGRAKHGKGPPPGHAGHG